MIELDGELRDVSTRIAVKNNVIIGAPCRQ